VTLLLLFVFLFAPQDKPPEKCSLSGIVLDSVTGKPLSKVELMLEPVDRSAGPTATTTSNEAGRFTMLELDPGRYHLKGTRNGYLETYYGVRRRGGERAKIQLDRAQCPGDLTLKLTPFGVIAGTVRDSDGEPLTDARVIVATKTLASGKPRIEEFDETKTDDLGQYRFRNLPPGKYYISAGPRATAISESVDHSPNSKEPEYASVRTFYPGVRDRAVAASIEVAAGARLTGIDVTLLRTRVFSITGRVTLPSGLDRVTVSLKDHEFQTSTKNPNGDFELRGVPAGSYQLLAGGVSLMGAAPVEVGSSDVSNVRVQFGAMPEVKGRIIVEGDKKPNLSRWNLIFTTDTWPYYLNDEFANATFSANLPPGHYTIDMNSLQGFYAKSIRQGELDILDAGLTIDQPGTVAVEITLASDLGKLDGGVQASSFATVVLIPSKRNRTDLFKQTATDQYGRYEFNFVPPGDYKLFAWDDVEPGAWFDPDFLKDFEKYGEPVTIPPNGHSSVQTRLPPAR